LAFEEGGLAVTTFSFHAILNAVLDEANHGGIFECEYDVNENQLLGDYRTPYLVKLRCCLAILCFRHLDKGSYSKIAKLMHREHSGIIHLIHNYGRTHVVEIALLLDAMEERLMRLVGLPVTSGHHQGVPFQ
jgi:hypothetical protein